MGVARVRHLADDLVGRHESRDAPHPGSEIRGKSSSTATERLIGNLNEGRSQMARRRRGGKKGAHCRVIRVKRQGMRRICWGANGKIKSNKKASR
jgi:hypothetical protein